MKVSIIVTAYNNSKYLKRCLDSIINQVYKNIEIIIIDDCSNDNSKEIIKKYAAIDKRIIPFYQTENKGASSSRNTGLKAATGDYIMFVKGTDSLTKDAIRRMVDIANKYNSDFVDSYHLIECKKNNKKLLTFTENKLPKTTISLGTINDNPKILRYPSYITGKLIKKELFHDILFEETLKYYNSIIVNYKLKTKVKNYTLLNKPIYVKQIKNEKKADKYLYYINVCKEINNIFSNDSKEIKEEIESILVSNMFINIIKYIKYSDNVYNDVKNTLSELIKLFPNYNENIKLNKFIKKNINKINNNEEKLNKFINKIKKSNFEKLYIMYLSIFNKYIMKNPLS